MGQQFSDADLQDYNFAQESLFVKAVQFLSKTWAVNKKRIIILILIDLAVSIYISQLILQNFQTLIGVQNYVYFDPISAIYFFFSSPISFLLGLVFFAAIFIGVVSYWLIRQKGYVYDPTIGVKVAASGEGGNAHFMTTEEENAYFHRSKDILKTKQLVMGIDDEGYYVAKNDDVPGTTPNMVAVGAAGSGKTTSIIYPFIQQCVRLGDSFITTDSKGDVYRETAYIARKMGYDVKVINLKPDEMKNSNGVDFFKTIHNETQAMTLTSIIMENSDGDEPEKKDFWFKCEYNLLLGLILFVKFTYPEGERNLVSVFDILVQKGIKGIDMETARATPKDPFYAPLRIFSMSTATVKESAYGGLNTRLSKINPPVVREILSHDELDFRAPMSRKCAYYFIIPDIVNSMKFLSCMLFTTLFNELTDEYDRRFNGSGKKPIHVRFILDEFKGTGAIPNFGRILSVTRSRKLHVYYILQDLSQLTQLYGEDQAQEILTNTSTKVLLTAGEPKTQEYFSSLTGERTIVSESRKFSEAKLDPLKIHPEVQVSQALEKRALMTASDIQTILSDGKTDKMLAVVDNHTIILNKFRYWTHPFYRIMKEHNEDPTSYIPEWRQKLLDQGSDVYDAFAEEEEWEQAEEEYNREQNEDKNEARNEEDDDVVSGFFEALDNQIGDMLAHTPFPGTNDSEKGDAGNESSAINEEETQMEDVPRTASKKKPPAAKPDRNAVRQEAREKDRKQQFEQSQKEKEKKSNETTDRLKNLFIN